MTNRDYLRFLATSAFGLSTLAIAVAAGLGGYAAFGLAGGLATLLGSAILLGFLGLATGLGPRAAEAEAERLAASRASSKIALAEEGRKRLAALRIADEVVASARDLVVLEAGRFLEACGPRRAKSARAKPSSLGTDHPSPAYDPAALAAIGEALELVNIWLAEADESAIERRFGSVDAHPIADAKGRVISALSEKAALLVRGRDLVLETAIGADRLSIEEELR